MQSLGIRTQGVGGSGGSGLSAYRRQSALVIRTEIGALRTPGFQPGCHVEGLLHLLR